MEEEVSGTATSSSSDESLDVKSDKFEPLKALYSAKSRPSLTNARVFDNLSRYEAVTKGISGPGSTKVRSVKGNAEPNPDGSIKRRFLPHQEPVTRRFGGDEPPDEKNVLTRMKGGNLGPLEMLLRCMEQRIRVKVFTRGARSVRGYVIAYVAAFDKHWNLALEDCLEVWTRKVKSRAKAPALGLGAGRRRSVEAEEPPEEEEEEEEEEEKEETPKLAVTRGKDGKTETVERHVPQLLIRGEQIAIVVKID